MKNLTEINTTQKCWRCEKIGFYIETPQGGDFVTCPCCNGGDFWSGLFYGERSKEMKEVFEKNMTKYFGNDDDNKNDKNDENEDMLHEYLYCYKCRIIYNIGCTHAENGCTDDELNAHVISKWKYKGEIYVGMPQFDSFDEYINEINNIEVLETVCLRNEGACEKASHKEEASPDSYGCSLPLNKNFVSSDKSLKYCFD